MGKLGLVRLAALGLTLGLGACATQDAPRRAQDVATPVRSASTSAPPPAKAPQIEKEKRYLRQHFLTDKCLIELSARAPEPRPGDRLPGVALYTLEFPPDSRVGNGSTRRLDVTERNREGWLYTSNGGGWYSVRGPLPLWQCLHDVPMN